MRASLPRVLLVGWDGADWSLLDRLLSQGRLPNLARLITAGFRAPLESTVPPVTPAAWTAMATGLNPGRSGVLGFRRVDLSRASGFDPHLTSSADLAGRTLFEHAASRGVGVALVGWPMTWPPLSIPGGAVLAGWPRPASRRAPTAPRALGRDLGLWSAGDPAPRLRRPTIEQEVASATWWDRRHREVGCRWLRERDDRLVAVVFFGMDHLSHLLWGSPLLDEHYERADRHLGALRAAAGPGAATLLVSDHGFGPAPSRRIEVGRWLLERGWATRAAGSSSGPLGRAAGAVRSRLPTRTWKSLRDRLPGRLRTWAYERAAEGSRLDLEQTIASAVELHEPFVGLRVWDEARAAPLAAALRNEPWVKSVRPREELFTGPLVERIPHLVVEVAPTWAPACSTGRGPIETPTPAREVGSHRRFGVLAGCGPGVGRVAPRAPAVADVGPTTLALAGVPVPVGLDGRVWTESIDRSVAWCAALAEPVASPPPRPRPELEESLRRLGYL